MQTYQTVCEPPTSCSHTLNHAVFEWFNLSALPLHGKIPDPHLDLRHSCLLLGLLLYLGLCHLGLHLDHALWQPLPWVAQILCLAPWGSYLCAHQTQGVCKFYDHQCRIITKWSQIPKTLTVAWSHWLYITLKLCRNTFNLSSCVEAESYRQLEGNTNAHLGFKQGPLYLLREDLQQDLS